MVSKRMGQQKQVQGWTLITVATHMVWHNRRGGNSGLTIYRDDVYVIFPYIEYF